jgi:hypothetical protein
MGTGRRAQENKPNLISYERGKPGGEGEGLWMPPLTHHRSTMGLKVARPWVGEVGWVPHGF